MCEEGSRRENKRMLVEEAVIRGRKGEGMMVCNTTCNLLMSCSTFSIQCSFPVAHFMPKHY